MKWWAVLLAALAPNSWAFDLDPVCHQYYQMFQMPDLTYENVGKLADRMHESNCWPAMQGLLETKPQASTTTGLPSCEALAETLIGMSTNVAKLFEARPMVTSDCGSIPEYCRDPKYLSSDDIGDHDAERKQRWIDRRRRECTRGITQVPSDLRYSPHVGSRVILSLPQCDLLVNDPLRLSKQAPKLGFRPVNCRGKIVYTDSSKAGLYFYMEQYSDGDNPVVSIKWYFPVRTDSAHSRGKPHEIRHFLSIPTDPSANI